MWFPGDATCRSLHRLTSRQHQRHSLDESYAPIADIAREGHRRNLPATSFRWSIYGSIYQRSKNAQGKNGRSVTIYDSISNAKANHIMDSDCSAEGECFSDLSRKIQRCKGKSSGAGDDSMGDRAVSEKISSQSAIAKGGTVEFCAITSHHHRH